MTDTIKQIVELFNHHVPLHLYLGISITHLEDGFARIQLPYRDEFIGDPRRPALHGGLISTLADTCGGAAVWSKLQPDERVSTVDLRVDFLRPARPESLVCEATCIRLGNMVGVTEMRVFSESYVERIVATGKAVYNVNRPKKKG